MKETRFSYTKFIAAYKVRDEELHTYDNMRAQLFYEEITLHYFIPGSLHVHTELGGFFWNQVVVVLSQV